MKFLFLVQADENVELGIELDDVLRWFEEIERRGARLMGGRLEHTSQARRISRRGGLMVTDGPFAESKEVIGGFDVIECPSIDVAVELAALHPVTEHGFVTVRPIIE